MTPFASCGGSFRYAAATETWPLIWRSNRSGYRRLAATCHSPSRAISRSRLLKVLAESGGSAKPRDIYPKVAAYFPELSAEEQEQRLESSASTRKWWNLVQWVRQRLVESREIDGSTRACGR